MIDSVPTLKIRTYIMKHQNADKYYVGKTINVERRMKEHKTDRWSNYSLIWCVKGDQEQKIKFFDVKRFIYCVLEGGTLS